MALWFGLVPPCSILCGCRRPLIPAVPPAAHSSLCPPLPLATGMAKSPWLPPGLAYPRRHACSYLLHRVWAVLQKIQARGRQLLVGGSSPGGGFSLYQRAEIAWGMARGTPRPARNLLTVTNTTLASRLALASNERCSKASRPSLHPALLPRLLNTSGRRPQRLWQGLGKEDARGAPVQEQVMLSLGVCPPCEDAGCWQIRPAPPSSQRAAPARDASCSQSAGKASSAFSVLHLPQLAWPSRRLAMTSPVPPASSGPLPPGSRGRLRSHGAGRGGLGHHEVGCLPGASATSPCMEEMAGKRLTLWYWIDFSWKEGSVLTQKKCRNNRVGVFFVF